MELNNIKVFLSRRNRTSKELFQLVHFSVADLLSNIRPCEVLNQCNLLGHIGAAELVGSGNAPVNKGQVGLGATALGDVNNRTF